MSVFYFLGERLGLLAGIGETMKTGSSGIPSASSCSRVSSLCLCSGAISLCFTFGYPGCFGELICYPFRALSGSRRPIV